MLTLQIAGGVFLGGVGVAYYLWAWNKVSDWQKKRCGERALKEQDERNKNFYTKQAA